MVITLDISDRFLETKIPNVPIVGSALMMNVQTDFTLFGYPGIAIVSFLLATTGAIALAIHIFFYDES